MNALNYKELRVWKKSYQQCVHSYKTIKIQISNSPDEVGEELLFLTLTVLFIHKGWMIMTDIYKFLAVHNIAYERCDHPPVFTVEDVHRLVPPLPAAKTKNLFLRDGRGRRHFLVVVEGDKRVDLKALPSLLDCRRLRFGSPERLKKYLAVDPGSVTLLAVVNDLNQDVEVIIDDDLWQSDALQFHPLVNTSTLAIARDNIQRFLDKTGHGFKIIDIPEQKDLSDL